ncbi:Cytochrome P450 [Poseidonocella pacifica]|uniref:Cytochrome P450 n=1 Tax=Poseidonocella pacifica TaxID=871651 RepID=A0A1I0VES5_9RHOB|nr:cytochrome P450 [Poseidonocella pacifica]SFA74557.1 Cytochrome P450 [Poseidonocella pacifica]
MTDWPPKPVPRAERVSLLRYARLFRRDILSAQPARLYRARMADFKTPFFRSVLLNEPSLVDEVLRQRPGDFPKSDRVGEGLRPLLGRSVFVTNGDDWARQRRIIDPAFEGGRLRESFPAMRDAADAAAERLGARAGTRVEIEAEASHAAADVIFRSLFSLPIDDDDAARVFAAFQAYQRSAPVLNLAALLPLPRWMPRPFRRGTRSQARKIRALISDLTAARAEQIAQGSAPYDLATKIMTTVDPETGAGFTTEEMIDQVAIFFLAGHETSASALAWALYLVAGAPEWQTRVAEEARANPVEQLSDLSRLQLTRDVFRETLRLYPPVPMMVREALRPETFRGRDFPRGTQVVVSPWHLHRHERHWHDPDGFDPSRWRREMPRQAFVPFSAGPRACPGAGFAMAEGVLLLSRLLREFTFAPAETPVPIAQLTVRSRDGIFLNVTHRR